MSKKPIGWRNESYRHSLASKGIKSSEDIRDMLSEIRRELDIEAPEDVPLNRIFDLVEEFNKVVPVEETQRAYCVEFARALRDTLGYGLNYKLYGHNLLKVEDYFVDSRGVWRLEDLDGVPLRDPDGWVYIYNEEKLDEYRSLMKDIWEGC